MLLVYKQLVLEMQRFFPELVDKIFVVNSPMFLEAIWDDELSKSIAKETADKVHFSASASHPLLADEVDEYELPDLYEGQCSCKATCVYSEKGPWSEVENRVNFQKPDEDSDS